MGIGRKMRTGRGERRFEAFGRRCRGMRGGGDGVGVCGLMGGVRVPSFPLSFRLGLGLRYVDGMC